MLNTETQKKKREKRRRQGTERRTSKSRERISDQQESLQRLNTDSYVRHLY